LTEIYNFKIRQNLKNTPNVNSDVTINSKMQKTTTNYFLLIKNNKNYSSFSSTQTELPAQDFKRSTINARLPNKQAYK
jgi:hypothetical protein